MTNITNQLKELIINEGFELTEVFEEAIYLLEDGSMIDGMFYNGLRSEDHRMIEIAMDIDRYDNNFWNEVHSTYNVVRLVPETQYALITENQVLSDIQKQLINEYDYEIEVY